MTAAARTNGYSRREVVTGLGAALLLPLLPGRIGQVRPAADARLVRIRTVTAGVSLRDAGDLGPVEAALAALDRARQRFLDAGYEVQTVRVALAPIVGSVPAAGRAALLERLRRLDAQVARRGAIVSLGPILEDDRDDPALAAWAADLVRATTATNFSVTVASPERGVHRHAAFTAATVIAALAQAIPGGTANFRFAAAARVPPGTPFFPVAYHRGPDSLAIGLESPRLVKSALAGAGGDPAVAERRLRQALDETLAPIAQLGAAAARESNRAYLGIDPSPAPGFDSSIGDAIEALTGVPFGAGSTLAACAAVTAALKTLRVETCGYAGLMLPVLEDPVLARRAAEGRFGVRDLLLFSAVCGTGLDVVPLAGSVTAEALARAIADVAALATRLQKPLSARLFPVPGAGVGDPVKLDDSRLAASVALRLE